MVAKSFAPWTTGLACAIGLTLGLYFVGAGLFDLCYTIGPIRPGACESGPRVVEQDSSLVAIGILLALLSVITLAYAVKRRRSLGSAAGVVWFARSVFVVGISTGILIFYGSLFGICDPFGPFGTTGTFCTSFDPYEAIGPLLALVSLVGLVSSFRLLRTGTKTATASKSEPASP